MFCCCCCCNLQTIQQQQYQQQLQKNIQLWRERKTIEAADNKNNVEKKRKRQPFWKTVNENYKKNYNCKWAE